MKKSDAIDKLQDILIDELHLDFLYCNDATCKKILNRIEYELGMIPNSEFNEWEPEDDKRD